MKKTLAIPAHLSSDYLNEIQKEELKNYGDQVMSEEEILAHRESERIAAEKKVIRLEQKRKAEIIAQLDALDLKAIRPLIEGNKEKLAEIEAQKAALRAQL